MRGLSEAAFRRAEASIRRHGRRLERECFRCLFGGGDARRALGELGRYQNSDGGFGRALELDFRLPSSSPLATSLAFGYIEMLGADSGVEGLAGSAIGYLEKTFDGERGGWYSVPREVNDHPHAPWYHHDPARGGTVIDEHWGNPTAEILGYMVKHRDMDQELDVDSLVRHAIDSLNSMQTFESPHEIYCYIRMRKLLPDDLAGEMTDQITRAVRQLVVTDPKERAGYVPQPLDFVRDRGSDRFGIGEEGIDRNLDYLVDMLDSRGRIDPSWEWGSYATDWQIARREWIGVLTLRALVSLRGFERV